MIFWNVRPSPPPSHANTISDVMTSLTPLLWRSWKGQEKERRKEKEGERKEKEGERKAKEWERKGKEGERKGKEEKRKGKEGKGKERREKLVAG